LKPCPPTLPWAWALFPERGGTPFNESRRPSSRLSQTGCSKAAQLFGGGFQQPGGLRTRRLFGREMRRRAAARPRKRTKVRRAEPAREAPNLTEDRCSSVHPLREPVQVRQNPRGSASRGAWGPAALKERRRTETGPHRDGRQAAMVPRHDPGLVPERPVCFRQERGEQRARDATALGGLRDGIRHGRGDKQDGVLASQRCPRRGVRVRPAERPRARPQGPLGYLREGGHRWHRHHEVRV